MIINDDPLSFNHLEPETSETKDSIFIKIIHYQLNKKIIEKGKNILIGFLFLSNLFLLNNPFIGEKPVFAKDIDQNESVEIVQKLETSTLLDNTEIEKEKITLILEKTQNETIQNSIKEKEIEKQEELVQEFKKMMENHPMAEMSDLIAQEDEIVAALIVGIGKKESNWGKRSPQKDGQDCYNYWGFKTSGSRGQALGHACFGSRKEAVETIAKRINKLVKEDKKNTPAKMIIWKCGYSCEGHDPKSVDKWISDVQIYYNKVLSFKANNNS